MELVGKKVLVCGLARSGRAAALLLQERGARVTVQDKKTAAELTGLEELRAAGIALYLGKNPDEIVQSFDLLVLSPAIRLTLPFLEKARALGIEAIGELELAARLCPCPIAAVTGTNGKTTTTTLLGQMLGRQYPGAATVGNIGIPFCGEIDRLRAEDYVAAELSSQQLAEAPTFHPHVAAVLNVTPDHLDWHGSMEAYVAAKAAIFQNQTAGDVCVLNYEDVYCREMAKNCPGRVFFFSSRRKLEQGIYLENGEMVVDWGDFRGPVFALSDLHILGSHNHENVMAAVAMALCAGVSLPDIQTVLRDFWGVEHRIEFVANVDGVDYYDDSKGTNPDAALRAVLAMVRPTVLIGGGYDKKISFKPWIAAFPGKVKALVLIGQCADQIEQECREEGFTALYRAETFPEAVAKCRELAQSGDAVLLSPACASWGMFKNYEERGDQFKELVRDMKPRSGKEALC